MAVLTIEQYQTMRAKAITVAVRELIGRSLIPSQTVDVGTQEYGYDKLTDMTAAEIISKYAPGSKDTIAIVRKTASVPILHKGFKITRIDLMSSNRVAGKSNLKAIGMEQATRKVATLEDQIIFSGDAEFGIPGMVGVAGNAVSGHDWSGTLSDEVNPYNDILTGKAKMQEDGFKAKFLALNPINAAEAMRKIVDGNGTWMEMIQKIVPSITESMAVPLGTFIMGDQSSDIAELIIAENYEILDANLPGLMVYDFDIITRTLPMFYEYGEVAGKSDAFCVGTGV